MSHVTPYNTLDEIAKKFRDNDKDKKKEKNIRLLFAYNGVGKTRLSVAFKNEGKKTNEHSNIIPDTLYFNAFTEDLFTWENDLQKDKIFLLKVTKDSDLVKSFWTIKDKEKRIKKHLKKYVDFDFDFLHQYDVENLKINYDENYEYIAFKRNAKYSQSNSIPSTKISKNKIVDILHILGINSKPPIKMSRLKIAYLLYILNIKSKQPIKVPQDKIMDILHTLNIYDMQPIKNNIKPIKISRGEERIFIWCLFLTIIDLVLEGHKGYSWVKYIYIDDPISSLDENNTVQITCDLTDLIKTIKYPLVKKEKDNSGRQYYKHCDKNERINEETYKYPPRIIISTHHPLFFNILWNNTKERKFQKNRVSLFLLKNESEYTLTDTGGIPFLYHVAMIQELEKCVKNGTIQYHHFAILRSLFEKTASFHGYSDFEKIIDKEAPADKKNAYKRFLHLFTHGGHSIYQANYTQYNDDFEKIFDFFIKKYDFNLEGFAENTQPPTTQQGTTP